MLGYIAGAALLAVAAHAAWQRLALSRAKHRSLAGHARLARRVARLVPYYEHGEEVFFQTDGAPAFGCIDCTGLTITQAMSLRRRSTWSVRGSMSLSV